MSKHPADSHSNTVAVQATNDDASASKLSCVKKGYMRDDFIHLFVRRPIRRSPIINRGYFARWAALRKLLFQFLNAEANGETKKQVLSLGAGFDATYFQLKQVILAITRTQCLVNPCPTCADGSALVGAINNVSFVMPSIALVKAHYYKILDVFTDDFPVWPPAIFNFTGNYTGGTATKNGTRVYLLPFNSTVQIVLQGTSVIAPESHPIHLHGFNFFVVGKGFDNFDPTRDSMGFNLVDPVERNTIDAPTGGWAAIRFRADNPGVWFMHCHLEVHTTWGLKMAFVVDDGEGPNQSLPPPSIDFPKC